MKRRTNRWARIAAAALVVTLNAAVGGSPRALSAQSSEHSDAYRVVTTLFDAMRARDTAAMRAAFADGAALQSVGPNGVQRTAIDNWIGGVARAQHGLLLDERLGDPVVHVDGGLATIWVKYWFFVGDRFSHCGVDAFVLARESGSWRILSVADTRQREGCPEAPAKD